MKIEKRGLKHGMYGTNIYKSYHAMKERCCNPKTHNYKNYGGRGITVCEKWLNSFENFFEDMGERPENTSLDRIDNNENYCRENCRWATIKVQANNKRNNRIIEFNGKVMNLTQWANYLGTSYSKLRMRLYKLKWSIEKSFTYNI